MKRKEENERERREYKVIYSLILISNLETVLLNMLYYNKEINK
jgi:hypothetical protein